MRLDINLTSGIFDNANAILSFSLASTSKPTNAKEGFSILLILLITEILMIHSVIAGSAGSFHNLQNEMSEIKHMQSAYIKALADETNMTEAKLKRMLNKKVNIYLSAEEAVELGIADIIV